MSVRKTLLIIGIVVSIVVTQFLFVLFIIAFPWLAIMFHGITAPKPPEPEIKYAEFPFTLVYEHNGEIITVQDIYVCEFDGFSWYEGVSEKYRTWDQHLKSNPNEGAVLLTTDGDAKIYCNLVSAKYQMGDADWVIDYDLSNYTPSPTVYRYILDESGGRSTTLIKEAELWEKYKIRIIDYEISDPIENSFSEQDNEIQIYTHTNRMQVDCGRSNIRPFFFIYIANRIITCTYDENNKVIRVQSPTEVQQPLYTTKNKELFPPWKKP